MAGVRITGTQAAFAKMLEQPAVYKKLGVSHSTVANWKRYLAGAEGKSISTDKMEEMLLRYGARVKHEKIWEL